MAQLARRPRPDGAGIPVARADARREAEPPARAEADGRKHGAGRLSGLRSGCTQRVLHPVRDRSPRDRRGAAEPLRDGEPRQRRRARHRRRASDGAANEGGGERAPSVQPRQHGCGRAGADPRLLRSRQGRFPSETRRARGPSGTARDADGVAAPTGGRARRGFPHPVGQRRLTDARVGNRRGPRALPGCALAPVRCRFARRRAPGVSDGLRGGGRCAPARPGGGGHFRAR